MQKSEGYAVILIRRCLVVLLFAAFLCAAGWGEGWTQKGHTWSHSNGLALTFPNGYKVSTEKNGTLNANAAGGYVILVFTPVSGKEQMKDAMKGIIQAMSQAKVVMKSDSVTGKQNGVDVAFQDGETLSNGVPIFVKLGIFNKKESFLLMQLLVPKKLFGANEESLKKLFLSVK